MIKEQHAFMMDVARLLIFIANKGYLVTGGELQRPQDMQELYYYGYSFKGGKLIKTTQRSKTLKNTHGKRLAIDLNIFKNGVWINNSRDAVSELKEIGDYWESLDPKNRWGGDWNGNNIQDETFIDTPHFERKIG